MIYLPNSSLNYNTEECFFVFKDGDGKVSLEEYIGDMYHHDEEDGPAGEEPDWVKRERESFKEVRDTNNDGFMDNQEVAKIVFICIKMCCSDHLLKLSALFIIIILPVS